MSELDYDRDGINAVDLGVIGDAQYALSFLSGLAACVYRRPASHVGTYGGWRWECMSSHPSGYPTIPLMAELASRIAAAIQARRALPEPRKGKTMPRKVTINVGDRVGYRVAFLRSIGMAHSAMAHARGTVTALEPFSENNLAVVEWERGGADMPPRVLDQNLARVGSLAFTSEDQ